MDFITQNSQEDHMTGLLPSDSENATDSNTHNPQGDHMTSDNISRSYQRSHSPELTTSSICSEVKWAKISRNFFNAWEFINRAVTGSVAFTSSSPSCSSCPVPSHPPKRWLLYHNTVRLVDGGSRCAGRVEVLHRGQWGTVCGHGWDMRDAAVVCRELGCGDTVAAMSRAHFGQGSGQIWMNEVDCSGSESTVKNCKSQGWGKHDCYHYSDAGVICSGNLHVRLVDGGSHCAGRVEVIHRGQWGTVCDDSWDMRDAAVVCRELRCGDAVDALSRAHFGPGSGPIWMDNVDCSGSESTLKNCVSARWGEHDCDHSKDAGVVCSGRFY
ncbi:soluble scavenger receptor cysteine-rich domain-containing protein SSC5D-like [Colossoma macropomum]|uniref:soluble scavenger receptor cysteine-rich domain-containing protein SSC5D-like n=1 Tax=Colossoma macropomum TaxID=42526 RepID=UPI001864E4E2|nr:soluble scavenger receptor cysteine-rich domain-containing protein SSC5D-like [Colossoma macropomum]